MHHNFQNTTYSHPALIHRFTIALIKALAKQYYLDTLVTNSLFIIFIALENKEKK